MFTSQNELPKFERDYAIITDMEPKLPAPNLNPERAPIDYAQNRESFPLSPSLDNGLERGEKSVEQGGESAPSAASAAPILPTPVSFPGSVPTVSDQGGDTISTDAPLVANDDDLIEKEWVDKAKKIIAETRDDPHRREREVGRLQADYLKKRYGKDLGVSD